MNKDDVIAEIEVVLHTNYGGFHVDTEMALWLMENKGWKIIEENNPLGNYYGKESEFPINWLKDSPHDYFFNPNYSSLKFRTNPDLIECVKTLKELHKNDVYPMSRERYIHSLKVVKIKIHASVEDYYDGKERINCWHHEE
jgi:hypothetical protein